MNRVSPSRFFPLCCFLLTAVTFSGCVDVAGGGYGSPYDDRYDYDHRYDNRDDYYEQRERERSREERRRLERERDRLEYEREALERQREREREQSRRPPPPPRPSEDRCPSGFTPSEQKCTPQERKRGCKDIRLPSGLGCVKR